MAARLAPDNVRHTHQSLHHLVADSPWQDAALLAVVRRRVLPAMKRYSPVSTSIVDDTGFPKKANTPSESPVSTAGNWANKKTVRSPSACR